MFFDLHAKERREELYGRDEELKALIALVRAENWVSVLGPRMVGKTSLIKVALSELRSEGFRCLYASLYGVRSSGPLLAALLSAINSTKGLAATLREFLSGLEEFTVGPGGITLRSSKKPMSSLWELFSALGRSKEACVVALDEVQELAPVSAQLLRLLGNVFTTYGNLQLVFSGSMFGLMRVLLEPKAGSPLYGRPPAKLVLKPFTPDLALGFLRRGLEEHKVAVEEGTLREAVNRLNGVVGWLTLFGNNLTVRGMGYREALEETLEQGLEIERSELNHFLEGRNKESYMAVLKAMVFREPLGARWSEVNRLAESQLGSALNPASLNNLIESLKAAGLVTEEDRRYRITDPLLRELLITS